MGAPQGYDPKEFFYRVGTFFLMVGLGVFVFFLISEAAGQPNFGYFCWSILFLILAFVARARYRKAFKPTGRFNLVKRLIPKAKKEQEKK